MRKIILFAFMVILTVCGCENHSDERVFDRETLIEEVGGLYDSAEIRWKDGSVVELKSVFVNEEYAFEQIESQLGDFIGKIRLKYLLPKLSAENYERYDAALWDYRLEKYGYPGNAPYEVMALNWFLSVLHNSHSNQKTIEMNGINDDAAETFGYLSEDSALKCVKLLTSELLEFLANEYDLSEMNEGNLAEYTAALASMDSEKVSAFEFEYELLSLFFSSQITALTGEN